MEDNILVEMYFNRNQSVIENTSKKYGNYCKTIAMNILHSKEDADECVNDTLLAAWETIPPQKPVQFKSFLGKIARNLAFDRYKTNHRKKRGGNDLNLLLSELEDCIPSYCSVEAEFDGKILSELVSNFLYTLEFEQRAVFVRRYWYADSIFDVAKRFGMSESKVKSMLMRARNKLRIYLEKEGFSV